MPDQDPSPSLPTAKRPHGYCIAAQPATPSLDRLLRDRVTRDGPLRFADFMAAALYQPGLGYYARSTRPLGRSGDFFTSVSVGPLFGELLARRFLHHWQQAGTPTRWRIIESGAHDGTLAADLLAALGRLGEPQALAALEYAIAEPLQPLQAAQRATLQPFATQVRWVADPWELADHPLPGIAFGNEVLDALPCHVVEWQDGQWLECRVTLDRDGHWAWLPGPLTDPSLAAAVVGLGHDFPAGYRTEVRCNYAAFLEPLARSLQDGLMVWIDYGFARAEYYHPLRCHGTLRTFECHRAGNDPFDRPGG